MIRAQRNSVWRGENTMLFLNYRFASNSLVLRNNFFLNHLPCFIVKWVNNIYVCTVRHFSTRHEKKIAFFFAVGESKTLNDKTVIYRNGRIRFDTISLAKTNLDARDLHSLPVAQNPLHRLAITARPHPWRCRSQKNASKRRLLAQSGRARRLESVERGGGKSRTHGNIQQRVGFFAADSSPLPSRVRHLLSKTEAVEADNIVRIVGN